MPNPPQGERGPCQKCVSYGGVHNEKFGDTICTNERGSGKRVSRMPEVGCSAFVRTPPPPPEQLPSATWIRVRPLP